MRYVTAVLVTALLACGGDATGPAPPPGVDLDVNISQSPADSLLVATVASDSMVVEVTGDLDVPLEGELVNFATDPEGCADSDADALQTNTNGRVFFEVMAGTEAVTSIDGPCTVMAIRSRDGRADRADSTEVVVLPGPVNSIGFNVGVSEPDTLFYSPGHGPKDQHGNPVAWRFVADSFVHAASRDPWTDDAKALVWDSAGTADVRVLHADTLLCTVEMTARIDGWVEKDLNDACD